MDVSYLVNRLHKEAEKSYSFFNNLNSEQMGYQIYTDGDSWTIHQILAHFVAAESGITRLIVHILDGGEGVPEDFDLDGYNERKVKELENLDSDELLTKFLEIREDTIDLVSQIGEDNLSRKGRHPWLGRATVGDIVKLMYRHNQIHRREIRKTLQVID